MGRLPLGGGPVFRFTQSEVAEMEAILQQSNNLLPPHNTICAIAEKFSLSPDRAGKIVVQPKQVWNWFQNKRYAKKSRPVSVPVPLQAPVPAPAPAQAQAPALVPIPSGKVSLENAQLEFEAKSARDGAWYDVAAFISHRMFETSNPEVRVRFSGFGAEEDEWINVLKCARQRSLPCEASECAVVLPGDLILCFQEGNEQALYFDAHVLDAQRRRHDSRGCRCRFLVRYDHDQSEEIVPLRKICRRPETECRVKILNASRASSGGSDSKVVLAVAADGSLSGPHKDSGGGALVEKQAQNQAKLMDGGSAGEAVPPCKTTTTTTTTTITSSANQAAEKSSNYMVTVPVAAVASSHEEAAGNVGVQSSSQQQQQQQQELKT